MLQLNIILEETHVTLVALEPVHQNEEVHTDLLIVQHCRVSYLIRIDDLAL